VDAVRALLLGGVDVEAEGPYRNTALIVAARNGHEEIVQLLISHGSRIDAADTTGWTALMNASWFGHEQV